MNQLHNAMIDMSLRWKR